MLINQFKVPEKELQDVGLEPIDMHHLGKFVALTGKNGAGKSRIIEKLKFFINARNNGLPVLERRLSSINTYEENIRQHPTNVNINSWQQNIDSENKQIDLTINRILSDNEKQTFNFVNFVPKQLQLLDPQTIIKTKNIAHFNQAKTPGLDGFQSKCLSYIQTLQDQNWEVTHPDATIPEDEKEEIIKKYITLKKLLFVLLKSNLGRSKDANATLFDKPIAESKLSDGQIVLIQFIVALHAQKGSLDNTVFVMDEPENHLHPSALIDFLNALSKEAKNSQFWIATHSIPLLSYIAAKEPMSIWYVEDGKVSNAGRHPEKVLSGLLGNEEQISYLHSFTSLPAQYAAINYAIESLIPPSVIGDKSGDPQVAQINNMIGMESSDSYISILDYGAGKSRLISGLSELLEENQINIQDKINYFAFDTYPDDLEVREKTIQALYGNDKPRAYSTREDFFTSNDAESIDIVVMCNVLHEIPPNEWLNTFSPDSLIFRSLKDSGYLLVVEDQRIPTGEKAHQFGFIVLDTPHLKTLFSVTSDDINNELFIISDHRNDGRLKAHLISKELLNRVNADTRKKAITELRATARDKINELRSLDPNYMTGQMHGFWTQQFANTSLFLEQT